MPGCWKDCAGSIPTIGSTSLISGMSCPSRWPLRPGARPVGALWRRTAARHALLAGLASLMVGVANCARAEDMTLDSMLAALAQHRHGHVLYTEQIESALLQRPLHTSGELFFDAPDRLEKKTLQPAAQDLIVEGDQLTMVRGKHRRSMRVSDYPQLSP